MGDRRCRRAPCARRASRHLAGRVVSCLIAASFMCGALAAPAHAGFDKLTVKRIIDTGKKRNAACYRELLGRTPGVEGKIVISFTIKASGMVKDTAVAASDFEDAAFTTCVTKIFSRLRFPKSDGDVEITYPLRFRLEDLP